MFEPVPFTAPYLLSSSKGQIVTSERKINLLENRLSGPSKDGLSPMDTTKLLSNDLDNFKIKLFQSDQVPFENTKSSSHKSSNSSYSFSNSNFLQVKRKRAPLLSSPSQQYTRAKTQNSISNKSTIKVKTKKIPIENNTKMNDYYKSNNSVTSVESFTGRKVKPFSTSEVKMENILNAKEKIINEKDDEISQLKQIIEDYKEKTEALNKYNNKYISEIDKCHNDIINFVKEIGELNRQKVKRDINDKQYTLGKYNYQKISNGQILEYWEEGEELKRLNQRYNDIKNRKNELKGMMNSTELNNNNDMVKFRLNCLLREETEIKFAREAASKQKAMLIHNISLLKEESKCSYVNNWDLLGERYQLVSLLGQGGYSEVYKGYDVKAHKYVACKIHKLNPNWKEEVKDSYIKHTIREDQIMKEIAHENIVTHYDTIQIDNNSFCSVLELCSGPDLGTYIKERKILHESEGKAIIRQVLKALEYLYNLNKKIIHYDIKPQNIIFSVNMEIVKLTDFGLAKIIENDESVIELTSQGVGTYYYLPPECFEKGSDVKINTKVDIWSIGVVLYEMLYGIKPFGHNCSQEKVIIDSVISNAKIITFFDEINPISNDCKHFIRKCLEFDPEKRYDVLDALNSRFIELDS